MWSLEPGFDALLLDACNREHARSCFVLASQLDNSVEATLYLTRACELKSAESCFTLGRRVGRSEPLNSWFHAACDIDAGYCLKVGQWLGQESAEQAGTEWMTLGCDRGDEGSCDALELAKKRRKARKLARDRAAERELQLPMVAREHWDKLMRDNPELEGATFLGVDSTPPGYSFSEVIVIRYLTKEGKTRRVSIPRD